MPGREKILNKKISGLKKVRMGIPPKDKNRFADFLTAFLSNFKEKRFIVSTHTRSFSMRIPSYLQFFVVTALIASAIWCGRYVAVISHDKKHIGKIKEEASELRAANKNLISHIEKVNQELDTFNNEINSKMSRKQEGVPSKKANAKMLSKGGKYVEASNLVIQENLERISMLTNNLNIYLSYIIKSIESLGLSYESFINQYPEFQSVKIVKNLHNISSSKISEEEKYAKYKQFYFFSSPLLERSQKLVGVQIGSLKSNPKWKYQLLKRLNTVLDSLPIETPLLNNFRITSHFGYRIDPFKRSAIRKHKGIDLKGDANAVVVSSGAGKVLFAGKKPGYGNIVEVNHGNNIKTRYAHLKNIIVSAGQLVKPKQPIGYQGATGSRCKGAHLHYELLFKNRQINPIKFLYAKKHIKQTQQQTQNI